MLEATRRSLVVLVPVALVAVVGFVLSSRAGAGDEWCERFALSTATFAADAAGGHATQRGALREGAELLAQDGSFDGSVLLAALDNRSGSDRYDPTTRKLFLDDKVQVQFGLHEFSDGTWSIGSMKYCA